MCGFVCVCVSCAHIHTTYYISHSISTAVLLYQVWHIHKRKVYISHKHFTISKLIATALDGRTTTAPFQTWRCLPSATLAPGLRWQLCGSLFHRPCLLAPPFHVLLVCDSRLRPSPAREEDAALRLRRRKGHQTLEPGKRFSVEKLSVCR